MTDIGPVEQEMRDRAKQVRQRFFARPDDQIVHDRTERPLRSEYHPPSQISFRSRPPKTRTMPLKRPAFITRYGFVTNGIPINHRVVFEGNCQADQLLRFPMTTERRIKLIMAAVALKYCVTINDIKSKRKSRDVAHARQEAMARVHSKTSMSLPQIGRAFGRDHTTVLHALRQFDLHPERYRRFA